MAALATFSETTPAISIPMLEILLVDDSEFDRVRIRRLVDNGPLPINLIEACSISEMKELLSEQRFDLILIDYHLEDGDGLQALRMLKASPMHRHIGIVMITGNERVEIATSAFRDGCHDFIAKSAISASTFQDTVERVLLQLEGRRSQSIGADELRAEIRGAVLASLNGREAQAIIADAVRSAQPLVVPREAAVPAGFRKVIAVEEDDQFRFI